MAHIIVIGAGIGGLTAGALLLNAGHKVTILEAQTYPGGSAGTYYHKGFRFDAGATLAGGFPQKSLFDVRGPETGIPNLLLVGDSIFPGQSTAGVTLGGLRVASATLQKIG